MPTPYSCRSGGSGVGRAERQGFPGAEAARQARLDLFEITFRLGILRQFLLDWLNLRLGLFLAPCDLKVTNATSMPPPSARSSASCHLDVSCQQLFADSEISGRR